MHWELIKLNLLSLGLDERLALSHLYYNDTENHVCGTFGHHSRPDDTKDIKAIVDILLSTMYIFKQVSSDFSKT